MYAPLAGQLSLVHTFDIVGTTVQHLWSCSARNIDPVTAEGSSRCPGAPGCHGHYGGLLPASTGEGAAEKSLGLHLGHGQSGTIPPPGQPDGSIAAAVPCKSWTKTPAPLLLVVCLLDDIYAPARSRWSPYQCIGRAHV